MTPDQPPDTPAIILLFAAIRAELAQAAEQLAAGIKQLPDD